MIGQLVAPPFPGTVFVTAITVDASAAANLPSNPLNGQTHRISVAGNFSASSLVSPVGFLFEADDYIRYDAIVAKWTPVIGNADIDNGAYPTSWSGDTLNAPSRNAVYDQFVAVQGEIDNIETAAGLTSTGTLSAFTDSYLSAQTNLKGGLVTLSGALSALQGEVDTTQTGAGLHTDGTLSSMSALTYLSATTSLRDGLVRTDGVFSATYGSISALQGEVDAVETAAGLASNGTLSAFTDSYLSAQTSLKGGLVLLSGVLSSLQGELDTTQTGAGLHTDGTLSSLGGLSYLSAATSLRDGLVKTDGVLSTFAATDVSMQGEIDNIETAAGLTSTGTLSSFTDSYLSAQTSLKGGLVMLSGVLSSIQTETDNIETAAGLTSTGTLSAFTDSYLSAQTSLKGGLVLLSGALSAIQTETDAIETATGLTGSGTLSAFSGTHFLDAKTSLQTAIVELDSKIFAPSARTDATATITVTAGDSTIIRSSYSATGTVAVSLPSIATCTADEIHRIVDIGYLAGTNNITITPNGADKIDNAASYTMNTNGETITIVANKATNNWEVL